MLRSYREDTEIWPCLIGRRVLAQNKTRDVSGKECQSFQTAIDLMSSFSTDLADYILSLLLHVELSKILMIRLLVRNCLLCACYLISVIG